VATLVGRFDFRIFIGGEEAVFTQGTTPPSIDSLTKKDDQLYDIVAAATNTVIWVNTAGPLTAFTWAGIIALDGEVTLEIFDGLTTFSTGLREGFPCFLSGANPSTGLLITRLRITNPSVTDNVKVRRLLVT